MLQVIQQVDNTFSAPTGREIIIISRFMEELAKTINENKERGETYKTSLVWVEQEIQEEVYNILKAIGFDSVTQIN